MHIIIVGAGISGLTLSLALALQNHKITLLESAPTLTEIGAGIQMTPQAIKYLFYTLNLESILRARSIIPERIIVRDYKDGSEIGGIDVKGMERAYGAPYLVVHRAVLHEILVQAARERGVAVRTGCRVKEYRFEEGVVVLESGETVRGGMVVGADGINSFARSRLLGSEDPGAQQTGFAAIRMMAEVSKIKADPALAGLVDLETNSSNFWIAPEVSCMSYFVKDATMLNIVLSHRDDVDTTDFTVEEYRKLVKRLFKDFEPRVQSLLALTLPKIANWPVYAVPPLPRWTHPTGKFVLVGDAAHAMAFYLSMGVSLAVEDAVSLATALGDASEGIESDPEGLKSRLRVYEAVRKDRAEAVARQSLRAGRVVHMPDGPEREEMKRAIADSWRGRYWPVEGGGGETQAFSEDDKRNVYGIADKTIRDWCYGYDAVADTRSALAELEVGVERR